MPGWLIDLFGSREINDAFWLITLLPAPAWLALIFFPNHPITRTLASPFLMPPLLGGVYVVLIWQLGWLAPDAPHMAGAREVRGYITHPAIFLLLWTHLQMANLFVAAVLLYDGRKRKLVVTGELVLCWLFAPAAVVIYSIRRLLRRPSLRP